MKLKSENILLVGFPSNGLEVILDVQSLLSVSFSDNE